MGLPGITELALTEIALTGLLRGTLLSQINLPGRADLALTTSKVDLVKETELRTGTIRGNVEKSFKYKFRSLEHTSFCSSLELIALKIDFASSRLPFSTKCRPSE